MYLRHLLIFAVPFAAIISVVQSSNPVGYVFPIEFKFGAASSAYQSEGAPDKRGVANWDKFLMDDPRQVIDVSNADNAAKSYEFYKKDVEALKKINANFYRFSFSWPRILPTGELDSKNVEGIEYYHKLIDELIDNNIEPLAVMFHWDMPQALEEKGGWRNPIIIDYFSQYAAVLFNEYGTKVKNWITMNEQSVICGLGYGVGIYAPGVQEPGVADYLCSYHTTLAHARAYHLYKDIYKNIQYGRVGNIYNVLFFFPEDPTNEKHILASERAMQFITGFYLHPLIHGDYPEHVLEYIILHPEVSRLNATELEYVKGTLDFMGVNYFTSRIIRSKEIEDYSVPSYCKDVFCGGYVDTDWPKSSSFWLYAVPEGLYRSLQWIKTNYNNIDVIVTANGWNDENGTRDVSRIDYLQSHIEAVFIALQKGCNVIGYTVWSLTDSFEWTAGFSERFGIFEIDFNDDNRDRKMKDSAKYLAEVYRTQTVNQSKPYESYGLYTHKVLPENRNENYMPKGFPYQYFRELRSNRHRREVDDDGHENKSPADKSTGYLKSAVEKTVEFISGITNSLQKDKDQDVDDIDSAYTINNEESTEKVDFVYNNDFKTEVCAEQDKADDNCPDL